MFFDQNSFFLILTEGIIIAYILCSQKDLVVILRQRTNGSVGRVELRSRPPLYRGMCRHSTSNLG